MTQQVPTPPVGLPQDQQEARKLAKMSAARSFVDTDPIDFQVYIRSVLYSGIIAGFKADSDKRLKQSFRFKEIMFWTCLILLLVVTIIWGRIICDVATKSTSSKIWDILQTKATISSNVALLSAAIIPFVTAFIALPHTIVTNCLTTLRIRP